MALIKETWFSKSWKRLTISPTDLEGTVEGLNLDESADEERGVEVGKPVTFSVDAAGAGEGTLELVVSTPSTTVKAEVSPLSTHNR